ncbi:hypothetical protein FCR2A7T_29410 [Flavobacterium cauense R2A-7]|uniref:hypothetical protein n=1 Tax=Flavobacterium cauense TaxID=510946 RepID=UPI0003C57D2C|nr:hypothetical protein [Flavobacterium cauense]ESU18420.1 hypothetical protein FCR2A7T_29410 [Flavobacterium cauense R2A-7]KGO78576.1 hypothetical protein Q762_15150 [Flavobacterium cauense R2A-7]
MKQSIFYIFFAATLLLCFLTSCKKINHEDLNQVWVEHSYENRIVTYKSQPNFEKNKGGTIFKKNGVFISKQNASDCGTPPIHYTIETGRWKFISDSTVDVKHKYWGGDAHSVIKIIKLTPDELKIKFIVSER